jgi:hypothetical protein
MDLRNLRSSGSNRIINGDGKHEDMLSAFVLTATIALAFAFGITLGWGVLSVFLHLMSRRSPAPRSVAVPATQTN